MRYMYTRLYICCVICCVESSGVKADDTCAAAMLMPLPAMLPTRPLLPLVGVPAPPPPGVLLPHMMPKLPLRPPAQHPPHLQQQQHQSMQHLVKMISETPHVDYKSYLMACSTLAKFPPLCNPWMTPLSVHVGGPQQTIVSPRVFPRDAVAAVCGDEQTTDAGSSGQPDVGPMDLSARPRQDSGRQGGYHNHRPSGEDDSGIQPLHSYIPGTSNWCNP